MGQATAAQEPKLGTHIPALDGVRGLAILMVTGYRFTLATGELPPAAESPFFRIMELGQRGVDLFFVLSGFLITGILFDAKGQAQYFRNFYMRRSLRIFPLYYGVLFLAFVILPLVSSSGAALFADAAADQAWLWLYGTNILQAWRGEWSFGAFSHFWSLAVEEHFYLVWPLVIFHCNRGMAMAMCLGCMLLAPLLRAGLLLGGAGEIAAAVLTPCRVDALAIGGLLALIGRGPLGLLPWKPWILGVMAVSGVVLVFATVFHKRLLALPYSFYALFFGGVIWVAVTSSPASLMGCFWNSRTLIFFGKYSYGLYVFQNLLIPVMHPFFSLTGVVQFLGAEFAGRIVYALGMTAATIIVAWVSWHAYEKHFLKLKRYFEGPRAGVAMAGGHVGTPSAGEAKDEKSC